MQNLAPIVLFVYSRPEHTRRTLTALQQNPEAGSSHLYVFCDGSRESDSEEQRARIRQTREVAGSQKWCGDVSIVESDQNSGLAKSIVSGVTRVCEKHGRVIVLEDDLETSTGFLRYMNDALDMYADDERVMQVSGFNVPNPFWRPSTGLMRMTTSWGWATWGRAWQHYRADAEALLQEIDAGNAAAFDLDGHSFHREELEDNTTGKLRTWAVKWYASVFLRDGLTLYPRQTLVRNLGFDGTGENCFDDGEQFHSRLKLAKTIAVNRQKVAENPGYSKSMQRHFDSKLRQWTHTRLRDRVRRNLQRLVSGNRTSNSPAS